MPLHLGHHTPITVPTLSTIPKVVVSDHRTFRGPPHRSYQQGSDLVLQHFVARQPYCVEDSPLLHVLIDVRLGECGIGPKVPAHSCRPVAGQDRIQYITPSVRAMYVPRAEHRSLAVTKLVEHEQRVIARAPKVTLYDAPSCSPCTGLSELSMSKITRRCGART